MRYATLPCMHGRERGRRPGLSSALSFSLFVCSLVASSFRCVMVMYTALVTSK